MEKGVDPRNLHSSQKESEQAEGIRSSLPHLSQFSLVYEIPSVNKSQNENILPDELLSSVNDESS